MNDTQHPNRESWLEAATQLLRDGVFHDATLNVPDVHVSVGFPSTRALSTKKQRIGECWHGRVSADGHSHIFISPVLADPVEALATLVHELIHAAVGTEAGHKKPFVDAMKKVGLEGKPTATLAGEALAQRLNALVVDHLGPYPHPTFNVQALKEEKDKKKQSTRLLKAFCPRNATNGKPYTVRITKLHLEAFGAPVCPACQQAMDVEGQDGEESSEED